jgi:hypothetical protein
VTTTADSPTDAGSIRYIVSKAGGGDTIKFTSAGADLTSELKLDKKLTIQGPATIRQVAGSIFFLTIPEGKKITLTDLTLRGLVTDRYVSSINNYGELSMKNCAVSTGGSIHNDGKLDLKKLHALRAYRRRHNYGALTMEDCVVKDLRQQGPVFQFSGDLQLYWSQGDAKITAPYRTTERRAGGEGS